MKAINRIFIILTAMLFLASSQAVGQDIKSDFEEADSQFSYRGKPIHPGLVQEFNSWISDSGLPTTISVDVSAPHGNEYFEGDVTIRKGKYVCNEKDGGWFCYEWLGKLNNGLHVLSVGEGGSGSGVFEDLFFVRFDKGEGYTLDGKKYERLLMSIDRIFILGDRDDGEITVQTDRVIVGKSRYRDKDVTLFL